jgi:hypothetical protein
LAKAKTTVSVGVLSIVLIAIILVAGFVVFLSFTLNSTGGTAISTNGSTRSTSQLSQPSSSLQDGTSSQVNSQYPTNATLQVINSNITVYYGTACMIVELFQLSCPTMNTAAHSPSLSNVELIGYQGIAYYALNFTFYLDGQPVTHTVWFTNSTVFCVSPISEGYDACPIQAQPPSIFSIDFTTNSSLNPSTGLQLDMNLSIDPSAGLTVKLDEYNTLGTANNVTAANKWPIPPNNLGDFCMTNMMGYAVYQGNYGLNNYTQVIPLALAPPNVQTNCRSTNPPHYYLFSAQSSVASISPGSNFPSTSSTSLAISTSSSVSGHWAGTVASPSFNAFPQGEYTVIAVDEWGQVTLLHFITENDS